jgi:hypothetical protein
MPSLALNVFGNVMKLKSSFMSSLVLAKNGELELNEDEFAESEEKLWDMLELSICLCDVTGVSSKIESRLSKLKSSHSKSLIPLQSITPVLTSMDLQLGFSSKGMCGITSPHFFPLLLDDGVAAGKEMWRSYPTHPF